MKKYLLTWYGITDLRAAMGFESTGGPILAALRACHYSDTLILAYTDSTKSSPDILLAQKQWRERIAESNAAGQMMSKQDEMTAVDAFANTTAGHDLYKTWLVNETHKPCLQVSIRMCPKSLASLNDAEGIYDAAAQALEIVSNNTEDKDVTFYLSPGTPVMAFTWAFVSLHNPELNIKIIACPDFRKPPEPIQLPHQLTAPSNRNPKATKPDSTRHFDCIFHLFGEQRMPSVFGVAQFPCTRHIFVTSGTYPADIMRRLLPQSSTYEQLLVNPFDPASVKVEILRTIAQLPQGIRIGFNLTGGTKLMYAGAMSACQKTGGIPFYFETRTHRLILLNDFTTMEMRGVDNVDAFLNANSFIVANRGSWDDRPIRQQRIDLTKLLWNEKRSIAAIYKALAEYADYEANNFRHFSIEQNNIAARLDRDANACVRIRERKFAFKNCPDLAKYLAGGWLEEYAYLQLSPLLKQGPIRDMRIGLEVTWDEPANQGNSLPAQEFDIVLTDGKQLVIVECKAGNVTSDHIYKLQTCVRNCGGMDAIGILVAAFPPTNAVVRRRLDTCRNINTISVEDIGRSFAKILNPPR